MTLDEFLFKYDQVTIVRSGVIGTTGYTVRSSEGLMATIGHNHNCQKDIEQALQVLSSYIDSKKEKDKAAELAARQAKIKRVIKF